MAVRIMLNSDGIRELLRSDEVRNDLEDRAARIAAAAGDGFEHESEVGANRARAVVFTASPEAMRAESDSRALTKALDAGR